MQEGDELIYPEDGSAPTSFRRKFVTKREEVEVRDVKVKMYTPRLLPCTYEKQVKVNKFVETEELEEHEEKYIEYDQKVEKKQVKIWVEETVEEEYEERLPVQKYRTVKVPITNIEEVDDVIEVEVDHYTEEEITGWRIDEIEDRKIVEVEEWEIFELLPEKTGDKELGEVKDLGFINRASKRTYGRVYKHDEAELAREDGIDLEKLEIDVGPTDVTSLGMFHGTRAISALHKHADPLDGLYDEVDWMQGKKGPAADKGGVSGFADEPEMFNLPKCLEYTRKSLNSQNVDGLDVDEFIEQLESRWRFVDADEGGLVEKDELRLAVWQTEEDNAGIAMPNGKFRKELQDIVDEIWQGTGAKPAFSIWDFVRFMLDEQLLEQCHVPTPPLSEGWAHARPSDEY